MARLAMSFLGAFEVLLNGVPITDFESNKDRALLAYLAVESERPHPREKLATLFWPQQTDKKARGNLRHSLSKLRKLIGDRGVDGEGVPDKFLLVSRQTIQFNQDSDSWLDVVEFNELLGSNESVGQIEEAVSLYRGEFLDGCCPADSLEFDEWVLFKREQFHRQALTALHRLAEYYEHLGQYERAIPFAWQQVELEPWREEGHRQLMHLLAFTGQRSAALAQYEACCAILETELSVPPAGETTSLYEKIRDGEIGLMATAVAVPLSQDVSEKGIESPIPKPALTPTSISVYRPTASRWWWAVWASLLLLTTLIVIFVGWVGDWRAFFGGETAVTPFLSQAPTEGKILEVCSEEDPLSSICVIDLETGELVPVTEDVAVYPFDGGMTWSPDGRKIVFSAGSTADQAPEERHNDIFIIDADGD